MDLKSRLDTFRNTKYEHAAKYGYYRINSSESSVIVVNCAFCKLELALDQWSASEEDVKSLHRSASPCCKFMILTKIHHWSYIRAMDRMKTFATWPVGLQQATIALANAGLVYTGMSDVTFCYFCGVTVQDWLPEDDPRTKHAEHSPQCEHVKFVGAARRSTTPATNSNDRSCKICYTRTANIVLMPCRHVYSCEVCFARLDKCPVCRVRPDNVITVFFA